MKSYCLYPIFPVSGKQIDWDPMKIPGGAGTLDDCSRELQDLMR